MLRRDFIKAISVWAGTWPLGVRAQQSERMRRIGVLMVFSENDPEARSWAGGFREELARLGWTEGHNIQINFAGRQPMSSRWSDLPSNW
jgi:putative tryptophan/tyrosine transport system substrate-binding protein